MYEKKLSEKKVCYADWIAGQEKQLRIDNIIVARRKKCLTNDSEKPSNGGEKNKNEGFSCRLSNNALCINFGPDSDNYYVINEKLMKFLVEQLIDYNE